MDSSSENIPVVHTEAGGNIPLMHYPRGFVDKFPWLGRYFANIELEFVGETVTSWCRNNYWIAPAIVSVYLFLCYFCTKRMKTRSAFDLRRTLKLWNLLLAIFSIAGMIRVVPHLVYMLLTYGFEGTICLPARMTYSDGPVGLWVFIYMVSKYFELIDTVFIVLRKRPLSFLHWYHHATVLWYTWDACCAELPAGIYFVAMNYTVHAVMYFYYFLAAQMKRPLAWGIFVTIAQISQMFIGIGVTVVSMYYSSIYTHTEMEMTHLFSPLAPLHSISRRNIYAAGLMYSTYLYLFAEYFVRRYIWKSRPDAFSKPKIV
ncbi:putative integral membrane protein, GNS1/SUR4 family protein [Cardiosporidium cionae]|uniref:Elongation of fatty acids protein n=1 Tax=Cardiosporidium cionae TaxID=476202 RepID=A0ABQ7J936_9APIC|nr:putative integral membrane protein, GNS1/SUR4 family protein [Cardiosporidium cionae]|eukprot:KAF8820473.1 putative integral membrane protein, GNS1/SUR4 family protein [Cardiosporidium cionae]